MAVRTGIAPMDLVDCSPEMLDSMFRVLEYQDDEAEKARNRR